MKLQTKPKKPDRITHTDVIYLNISQQYSLSEIKIEGINFDDKLQEEYNQYVANYNIKKEDRVDFETLKQQSCMYISGEVEIQIYESLDSYNQRVKEYEQRLLEYNLWYKNNKKGVDIEVAKRNKKKAENKEKIKAKRKVLLEAQLSRINKELAKVK